MSEAKQVSKVAKDPKSEIVIIGICTTPNLTLLIGIDVREPHEYAEGHIPHAKNWPINSSPEGLALPAEKFEEKFGFKKPRADQHLLVYCRAGVRSKAAATLADTLGYKNVNEYRGSWLDWLEKGGEQEKP
jgi:rhodanese-related sulfurtransferase